MEVEVDFTVFGNYSARIEAKAKKAEWGDLEDGMQLGDVSALKVSVCDMNLGGCALKEPVNVKLEGCAGDCDASGAFGTIVEKQTSTGLAIFTKQEIMDALDDFDSSAVGNEIWIRFSASSTSYQEVKTRAWKLNVWKDMIKVYRRGVLASPISVSEELETDGNFDINVCDKYGIGSLYLELNRISAGEVEFGFESEKDMGLVQVANIDDSGNTESYCYGNCVLKPYPLRGGITIANVDVNLDDSISGDTYVGDLIIRPRDVGTLDRGADIRLHVWAIPSVDCVESMPEATKTNIVIRRGRLE